MLSPLLIMPGFSAASTIAANLDIPRLFDQAHWIVKAVMLVLALMFVIGLYIIIYKYMYVRRATSESSRFTDSFWRSRDIEPASSRGRIRGSGKETGRGSARAGRLARQLVRIAARLSGGVLAFLAGGAPRR